MRTGVAAATGGALLAALTGCSALLGSTAAPSASAVPMPSWTLDVLNAAPVIPKTAAPALKNTGTAWPAMLASLSGYGQWLLANPDPSLAGNVATPGCPMHGLLSRQLTALHTENAYVAPSPPVFGVVSAISPVVTGQVLLVVTASRPAEPVLAEAKATPISSFKALPQTDLRISLVRGADNMWRFCTVTRAGDTGDGADPSLPLF